MQRRTKIAVLAAVLLLATGATGSAMASATDSRPQLEAAAVTGTAKLYRVAGEPFEKVKRGTGDSKVVQWRPGV
ncbi:MULTISPECIES: hypothetical protein [unclassified Streptomyces]|uniref:hypothetical protein n=1 Tax=unclassified Streptomyces TaxID=2593676 RepID=UPI0022559001|nr:MULTISPECIES: hypothetical protein [unclassified Streptomyces]MCX5046752.1 hypothetical protein [Streptomyces sp. NBC_00474]